MKELIDGLTIVIHGSQVDKLKFLFMVYDVDGMSRISNFNHITACYQ